MACIAGGVVTGVGDLEIGDLVAIPMDRWGRVRYFSTDRASVFVQVMGPRDAGRFARVPAEQCKRIPEAA